MILRNFLYLDSGMLNDFLSTIDGYIEEGSIDQTELEKRNKSGKAAFKVAEGNLQSETSTETKQKIVRTDASKFQRLYDYLQEEDICQFLDAFDGEIWNQIKRGELIEVPAKMELAKPFALAQDLQDLMPMSQIVSSLGIEPFKDQEEAEIFNGLSFLGEYSKSTAVPIIFETESTKGYKFYCQLQREYVRTEINNFNSEADIIGKVQRIIPKGREEEVYSIIPAFESITSSMNRDQRRKNLRDKKNNNLSQLIKGPAIIVTPLAIYR